MSTANAGSPSRRESSSRQFPQFTFGRTHSVSSNSSDHWLRNARRNAGRPPSISSYSCCTASIVWVNPNAGMHSAHDAGSAGSRCFGSDHSKYARRDRRPDSTSVRPVVTRARRYVDLTVPAVDSRHICAHRRVIIAGRHASSTRLSTCDHTSSRVPSSRDFPCPDASCVAVGANVDPFRNRTRSRPVARIGLYRPFITGAAAKSSR